MLNMDQYEYIRSAHRVYNKGIREIARETGHLCDRECLVKWCKFFSAFPKPYRFWIVRLGSLFLFSSTLGGEQPQSYRADNYGAGDVVAVCSPVGLVGAAVASGSPHACRAASAVTTKPSASAFKSFLSFRVDRGIVRLDCLLQDTFPIKGKLGRSWRT